MSSARDAARAVFEERHRNDHAGTSPSANGSGGAVPEIGITKLLADAICAVNRFALDTGGKLYRYSGGAYRKDAEKYVRRRVKELLEARNETGKWSSYRADEVVKYISADAPELWERPPDDEINLENGILNVFTRKLREHTPEHLSPVQIPIRYDPAAKCPAWEEYVEPCFPDDAPTLPYEIFASVITPYRATQKAVLLLGEGSNGKSTYLAALMRGLGRANCTSVTLQALETNRFASARLVGKLANVCADLPSTHLQETSVFKALTGDEGQISAEYKHRDSFEFEPYCQLVFSANHPPRSSDASHAFFRRWIVAPFDKTFEGDAQMPREELDRKLSDPAELSGMLNKALDALPGLRKNGFTESPKMREAWQEFRQSTDPVTVWLDTHTVRGPNMRVPKSDLHQAYNEWAEKHGQMLSAKALTLAVKRAYGDAVYETQVGTPPHRVRVWFGIGLKTTEPPPGPGVSYGARDARDAQDFSTCNEKAPPLGDGGGGSGDLCSKENPVHPVHPVHGGGGDVEELRRMALEALRTPGSGPALAWAAYSRGESSAFQYVVRAVAEFWHDGARWERWHVPVTLAVGELGEGP